MHQKVLATAIATIVAMSALHASTARAQSPEGPAETAERRATTLDSVTVTAERRTVNVQEMATAVSVIGGDELAAKAITRAEDLANTTPALTLTDTGATQSVNIRGIGIASNSPSVQGGVAIYQDGVFQLPILQANIFYDIASIEVLRGPQGTLAGNNSTGGAIFINTVAPEIGATGGYAEFRVGSHGERGVQGALAIPAGEWLAFRVAANVRDRDSYFGSTGSVAHEAGKLEERSIRLGALFERDGLKALARLERITRDGGGIAEQPIPGSDYAAGRQPSLWDLAYNSEVFRREDATTASLEVRKELDDGTVIRYVGGHADRTLHYLRDADGTTLADITNDNRANSVLLTHEINLISADTGRLSWVAGGYWHEEKVQHAAFSRDATGFPTRVRDNDPVKSIKSLFGHVDYALTDAVELQFGLRYSESESTVENGVVAIGEGIPGFPPDGQVVARLAGRSADDGVGGKFAVNWTLNERHMLYGLVARGYKSGGFNSADSIFGPEFVLNYELGWKSTQFDGRLRTQLNVFHNDYDGFQLGLRDLSTGQDAVQNIAEVSISGVEGQVQALFGEFGQFRVDAGFAYVDSEIAPVTFVNERLLPPGISLPQCGPGQDPASGTCFDYSPYLRTNVGGVGLYAPELTVNLGAQYEFALENGWTLTPRVNYAYVGEQYTMLTYDKAWDLLPSRALVSALLTARSPTGATTLELYGTNLADREYMSGQIGNNAFYGAPREYGVRLRLDF